MGILKAYCGTAFVFGGEGMLRLDTHLHYGVFWLGNGTNAPFSDLKVLGCALAIPNLAVWSRAGVVEA